MTLWFLINQVENLLFLISLLSVKYAWRIVIFCNFFECFRISNISISVFPQQRISRAQFYGINEQLFYLFNNFYKQLFGMIRILPQKLVQRFDKLNSDMYKSNFNNIYLGFLSPFISIEQAKKQIDSRQNIFLDQFPLMKYQSRQKYAYLLKFYMPIENINLILHLHFSAQSLKKYIDNQFQMSNTPKRDKIINSNNFWITEAIRKYCKSIAKVFLKSLHSTPTERIWLVFINLYQHANQQYLCIYYKLIGKLMDFETKRKVSYFYNNNFGKFVYSKEHPMKPERIAMAHSLVVNTGLYRHLNVYQARHASKEQMNKFHSEDYLNYLQQFVSKDITSKFANIGIDRFAYPPNQTVQFLEQRQRFKVGESTDCPAFNGLYNLCQISSGASIDAACLLLNGQTDIAINWTGGLHHAKKSEASGFCYVNDIVLSIIQLLQVYPRVLYLDIDVHHGDGVQQAFYLSNRCMSVSFHQYGDDFFPGTGGLHEVGDGDGKNYAINIPLKPGISDENFYQLFKDVMSGVMAKYRPHALVMQLGADSLCHDKLGQFNMSVKGHSRCLDFMLKYGLPTIMMGGGGYTIQNVSRCWAYQTGVALGIQIDDNIPKYDPFYHRYSFDQKIHFPVKVVEDRNTSQDINNIRKTVYQHLQNIQIAPGIQFHSLPSSISPWAHLPETLESEDEPFMI